MRNFLLSSALFILAPFAFIFTLVISLMLYNQGVNGPDALARGKNVAYAALPTSQNILSGDITQNDGRIEKVRQFFERYRSPLEANAADVVAAADEYGLDYRLLPAISMQESGACRVMPPDSYNCWGYGIYGKTVTKFKDYKEGIYTVTKSLATKYKARGLNTPDEIMTMYTPSSNGSWAFSVNHFMEILN